MGDICVLCGEDLEKYPINREHYVPQVLIREFEKLCIPPIYDWATRTNEYDNSLAVDEDCVSTSIKNHQKWAVVKVHEKCNLEASGMCRDLRHIIDHLDERIENKYYIRPLEYYAHLWKLDPSELVFETHSAQHTKDRLNNSFMLMYRPGVLDCGRITIRVISDNAVNDYEWHTIRIGTKASLAGFDYEV